MKKITYILSFLLFLTFPAFAFSVDSLSLEQDTTDIIFPDTLNDEYIEYIISEYEAAKMTRVMEFMQLMFKEEVAAEIQLAIQDSLRQDIERKRLDSLNNKAIRTYVAMERRSDSLLNEMRKAWDKPIETYVDEEYAVRSMAVNNLFAPIVVRNEIFKVKEPFFQLKDSLKMKYPGYQLPKPPANFYYTYADSLGMEAITAVILEHPDLVHYTEDMLPKAKMPTEILKPTNSFDELFRKIPEITKIENIYVDVPVVGFWITKGKLNIGFTQNWQTDNWYQGGENNINLNNDLNLQANYNNRSDRSWDNQLIYRLGFRTTPNDPDQEYVMSTDYLYLKSSYNLKAFWKFSYSSQLDLTTQCFRNRQNGKGEVISAFLSPGTLNIGLGLRYNVKNKKNTREFNLYISPATYSNKFVIDTALVDQTRHGIKPHKKTLQDFGGLKVEASFRWNITPEITYNGWFNYFSPYDYTTIDWNSTIDFYVNRYLTTRLVCNLRFDDNRKKQEGDKTYFQFKETLSLSFNFWW